jgi:hypothetical protein
VKPSDVDFNGGYVFELLFVSVIDDVSADKDDGGVLRDNIKSATEFVLGESGSGCVVWWTPASVVVGTVEDVVVYDEFAIEFMELISRPKDSVIE